MSVVGEVTGSVVPSCTHSYCSAQSSLYPLAGATGLHLQERTRMLVGVVGGFFCVFFRFLLSVDVIKWEEKEKA